MPLLLETIRIDEGKPYFLPYHEARMQRSVNELFGKTITFSLASLITPPDRKTLWRCRILYDTAIQEITYHPYTPRNIRRLALIESKIDYRYKYADRSALDALKAAKPQADDILIVKNGFLTDTTIANIAFFDGKQWLTPEIPLLEGTTRARLIDEGKIFPAPITPDDLGRFKRIALMNAMIGFVSANTLTIET